MSELKFHDKSEKSVAVIPQLYFAEMSVVLLLLTSWAFFNQSKTSPFFIISRHAQSQLANHYGKAGGALIQDNNTPWAFGATVLLRAFQQRCTVRHRPNWVVKHGEAGWSGG